MEDKRIRMNEEILAELLRVEIAPDEIKYIIYNYEEKLLHGKRMVGHYMFLVVMIDGTYLEIPEESEAYEMLVDYFDLKNYQGEYPYCVYNQGGK